ncbi:hypothetical protein LVY72_18545 [Arthrobacter sp. I2-34]|uniref:Phage protein n=1 Tax=Arthrobacter hankyongi TaxID=2904801 RepID=A0ABS9LBK3_9MICC|nr:hypothetical protein [Arthrobacter hankyongi]MCG2623898.1 hypothetical protein [Arthrobacter hankyongi]
MHQQVPGPSRENRKTLDQRLVRQWASLQPGDCVEVWSLDSFLYAAYVDDRSDDDRLIWVIENGIGCRHLFVRDDPVTLYSM